jgi:hypothetical protein
MGDPFAIAVVALGLSLGVSAIRLIDWFIHSEPKAVVRVARWAAIVLAVSSVPLLLMLLILRQWTAAVGLGAVMVLVLGWYAPRLLRQPFRLVDPAPEPRVAAVVDRELVERSIAVLEEFLRQGAAPALPGSANLRTASRGRINGHARSNGHDEDDTAETETMSQEEALEILGLGRDAQDAEIIEAHRRLVQLIHPDRGGSHYLTVQINQAKKVLLGAVGRRPRPMAAAPPRKAARRRTQRSQHP